LRGRAAAVRLPSHANAHGGIHLITSGTSAVSAVRGTADTASTGATCTTYAATGQVGLVTEQVDVDEVGTEAASTDATRTTQSAVAATATPNGAEQRQHGTRWQQLHALLVELGQAQCVRHISS
jgi:hypothetical protein